MLAAAAIFLAGSALTGCGSSSGSGNSGSSTAAEPAKEAPADLTGMWKSKTTDQDAYQEATINADSIEINWVSDGGDTKALYWAGTYEPPTEAGDFTWDSLNDTEKTSASIMASPDPTKTFTYKDDVISYEVSALGVTKTLHLERE